MIVLEIEADYIGMMLLAAAGYDPHEAPRALEKVGKMERKTSIGETALIPLSSILQEKVAALIATYSHEEGNDIIHTSERKEPLLNLLHAFGLPMAPRSGIVAHALANFDRKM